MNKMTLKKYRPNIKMMDIGYREIAVIVTPEMIRHIVQFLCYARRMFID